MSYVPAEEEIEFGFNAERLGEIFGLQKKFVIKLLKDCPADGDRKGVPHWLLVNAAPFLVTPTGNIEAYLRKLNPKDLPPKLQKEFWTALNLRFRYYVNRGDLWATSRVLEVMSDVLKILRETTRLFVDQLEGHQTITNEQRKAIQVEMDKLLATVREKIKEHFKNYDPSKDHGETLEAQNVGQELGRDDVSGADHADGDDLGLDEESEPGDDDLGLS